MMKLDPRNLELLIKLLGMTDQTTEAGAPTRPLPFA
jgi:hypothetical protein